MLMNFKVIKSLKQLRFIFNFFLFRLPFQSCPLLAFIISIIDYKIRKLAREQTNAPLGIMKKNSVCYYAVCPYAEFFKLCFVVLQQRRP